MVLGYHIICSQLSWVDAGRQSAAKSRASEDHVAAPAAHVEATLIRLIGAEVQWIGERALSFGHMATIITHPLCS